MIINNLLYKTNMLTNQKRWFVFSTAHVIMTNTCWPDVVSLREHWHAVKVFWTSDRQLHNSTLCKHTCLSGSCRGTLWFYLFPAGVSQSRPVDKVIILLFGLSLPTIMQCLWDWFTVRLVTQWIDHILDGKKGVFVGLGTAAFVCKFGLYVSTNNTDKTRPALNGPQLLPAADNVRSWCDPNKGNKRTTEGLGYKSFSYMESEEPRTAAKGGDI